MITLAVELARNVDQFSGASDPGQPANIDAKILEVIRGDWARLAQRVSPCQPAKGESGKMFVQECHHSHVGGGAAHRWRLRERTFDSPERNEIAIDERRARIFLRVFEKDFEVAGLDQIVLLMEVPEVGCDLREEPIQVSNPA